MSTRQDVAMAKLRVAIRKSKETADTVTVNEAADILGVSNRRIRAFIKPECNCVLRKRRARDAPVPNLNCPECQGSGHVVPRLKAILDRNGYYLIPAKALTEFLEAPRKTGRPPSTS